VHPRGRILFLRKFFLGGGELGLRVVNLAVLACALTTITKKEQKVVNFLGKKCTPKENPGYAYVTISDQFVRQCLLSTDIDKIQTLLHVLQYVYNILSL